MMELKTTMTIKRKRLTRNISISMIMVWLLAPGAAWGLDRSDLIFHAPLDGTLEANSINGPIVPLATKNAAEFRDAVMGSGAILKQDIRYTLGKLLGREGTLCFWVQPVDWRIGGSNHYFLRFNTPGVANMVYTLYWGVIRFYQDAGNERLAMAQAYNDALEPGRWRLLAVTWRGNDIALYMDGRRLAAVDQNAFALEPATDNTLIVTKGNHIMDDLMLFRRSLSKDEIRGLFFARARPLYAARQTNNVPVSTVPKISLGLGRERRVVVRGWNDCVLGLANDDPAVAELWRDADGLNVVFTYPISEAYRADKVSYLSKPLRGEAAPDTVALFNDDYFCLTIQPAPAGPDYQFAVNGAGATYDTRDGNIGWNGRWRCDHAVDDFQWRVAMHIPWADLGGVPEEGTDWQFDLRHRAVHLETFDSCWAVGLNQDVPALLHFASKAPAVSVAATANPGDGTIAVNGSVSGATGGVYTVAVATATSCLNALDSEDSFNQQDALAPPVWEDQCTLKERGDFAMRHVLADPLAGDLIIAVTDASGHEWFRQRRPFAYAVSWDVHLSPLPTLKKLIVELDAGGEGSLQAGLSADITIKNTAGQIVATQRVTRMKAIREPIEFSLAEIKPGDYRVETVYALGGSAASPIVRTFTLPERPVWLGTTVGLSDKVPDPWRPIRREGDSLEVWGRRLGLHGLLPTSLRILDQEVLAAPMRVMVGTVGHKPVPVNAASVHWDSVTERRAEFRVSGKVDDVTVEASNWVEFDGFMWVTLTLSGTGAVNRLAVEIPLLSAYAELWHNGKNSGYTPRKPYTSRPRSGHIGSANRGLQWCWETEQGWSLKQRNAAFQLIPGEKETLIRLTFIDQPTPINGQRTICFGLHPLPSKPSPPKGWREIWWFGPWRDKPERPMRTTTQWNGEENWVMLHHNYPNQSDARIRQVRQSVMAGLKKRNTHHAYKHFDVHTDANTPEYRLYGEEWRSWPAPRPDYSRVEGKPDAEIWAPVCYGSQSYMDFYLYHTHRYLSTIRGTEKLPINIYIDCTGPNSCANPYHGCGWIDEKGIRRPQKNILAQRRYMMRLNQMFRDLGEDTWITVHMSQNHLMAVWSFADMIMPGEEWASFFSSKRVAMDKAGEAIPYSYMSYIDLPHFRALYTSTVYGTPMGFLNQAYCWFNAADRAEMKRDPDALTTGKLKAYTAGLHHLTGMCIVHDTLPWGGSIEEPYAIRTKFKWDDQVRFHGYWSNHDLVTLDIYDEQKYVLSLMTRPERFLLIAFNNTDEPVTGTATLNLEKLGFSQATDTELLDLLTDERIPISANRVTFTIPPRAARLLMYGTPWDWRAAISEHTAGLKNKKTENKVQKKE